MIPDHASNCRSDVIFFAGMNGISFIPIVASESLNCYRVWHVLSHDENGHKSFRCPFRAKLVAERMPQGGTRCASLPWADFRHPFGAKLINRATSKSARKLIPITEPFHNLTQPIRPAGRMVCDHRARVGFATSTWLGLGAIVDQTRITNSL